MRARFASVLLLALLGCGGDDPESRSSGGERPLARPRGSFRAELCTETGDQYLPLPYDTNGDGAPDVIRIYLVSPSDSSRRIVCREADLNLDGTRDNVRIYDERGRVARDQKDRDFDGRPDFWEVYDGGRLIRTEEDADGDGRVDTRTFFDLQGRAVRVERDTAGRSEVGTFRRDHYDYFASDGRLTRTGADINYDGTIDRWDRDRLHEDELEARERLAALNAEDAGVARAADAAVPDGGAMDGGVPDGAAAGARAPDGGVAALDAGPRTVGVAALQYDGGVNRDAGSATSGP